MTLYHGSKQILPTLKPSQATGPDDSEEAALIPEDELMNAIYFTDKYEFALAMAARPYGLTKIHDNKITFEHPELFDPNQVIYIYEVDSSIIPEENIQKIDDLQYAVIDMEEIKDFDVKTTTAREVMSYYELVNWKENQETSHETHKEARR